MSALFATNFSPNGLTGDYGGILLLDPDRGHGTARRLYLLNERIAAARALEFGMVHAVLPAGELRPYTYEMARRLVQYPAALLAPRSRTISTKPRRQWTVDGGCSPMRRRRSSRPFG